MHLRIRQCEHSGKLEIIHVSRTAPQSTSRLLECYVSSEKRYSENSWTAAGFILVLWSCHVSALLTSEKIFILTAFKIRYHHTKNQTFVKALKLRVSTILVHSVCVKHCQRQQYEIPVKSSPTGSRQWAVQINQLNHGWLHHCCSQQFRIYAATTIRIICSKKSEGMHDGMVQSHVNIIARAVEKIEHITC